MISTLGLDVTGYLDIARSGERRAAVRFVLGLLEDGVPAPVLVTDLLAAAQREVGVLWHRGDWSTADEHVTTAATEAALTALTITCPEIEVEGRALIACAEGDWHALPAQMFAELLRARGQGTIYLGPSTPADDVAAYLERQHPDAVTVTCSTSMFFLGTTRLIDAAHRHGIPVVAGGSAMNARRATALGADAWAADPDDAADVLRTWRHAPLHVDAAPVHLSRRARELDRRAPRLAQAALADVARRLPALALDDPRRWSLAHEELTHFVRYLAAARLVADATVFTEFRLWLTELHTHRGVPAAALAAGIESLAPLVVGVDDGAYELLSAA